jgi:hypothetical protein
MGGKRGLPLDEVNAVLERGPEKSRPRFLFAEKPSDIGDFALMRLILFLFTVSLLPGRANLGDTIAQAVGHYGHPIGYAEASARSPFGNILFRSGGYELVLFILDGKEVGARVSKLDKSPFTDQEIKTIMDADNGAGPWTPTASSDPSTLVWSRSDHATVLYDRAKNLLMLTSKTMADAVNAQAAPGQK